MSKLRRRQEPCSICGLKPAPFRMTEQKGKTIKNKGRICVACLQTWQKMQRDDDERGAALQMSTKSTHEPATVKAVEVPVIHDEKRDSLAGPRPKAVWHGCAAYRPGQDVHRITCEGPGK